MRVFACLLLLLSAAAILAGCPKAREKVADKVAERAGERAIQERTGQTAEVDVNRGAKTVSVTGEEGKHQGVTGPAATLPADWPKELPAYPDAEIIHSATNQLNGKPELTVDLRTRDSTAQVLAYYADQAKAAGYTPKEKKEFDDGSFVAYEAATKRFSVTVLRSQGTSETYVGLVLMERQP
jgi:hypothetical protein